MLSIDNQTGICTMVNCASKVAKCVADNDCRATMACSKACQDLPRNRSVKRVKICLWSQEQLYTLPNLRNVSNGSNFFLIMLFFNLMKGKPCAVTFARWRTVTRTRSSRMSCSAWSTTSVFRTIQGLVNKDNTYLLNKQAICKLIWESLIWPLSPRFVKSAGSNLTLGTLVERVGSEHQS